jgi:hypothetical protein
VAEGALDAERAEPAILVEETGDPDDGVGAQQFQCRLWVVETDRAALEDFDERLRHGADIDLQAELQRLTGGDAGADAAEPRAGDRLMQLQLVAPERLAPEGVVAEDLAPVREQRSRVLVDLGVEASSGAVCASTAWSVSTPVIGTEQAAAPAIVTAVNAPKTRARFIGRLQCWTKRPQIARPSFASLGEPSPYRDRVSTDARACRLGRGYRPMSSSYAAHIVAPFRGCVVENEGPLWVHDQPIGASPWQVRFAAHSGRKMPECPV